MGPGSGVGLYRRTAVRVAALVAAERAADIFPISALSRAESAQAAAKTVSFTLNGRRRTVAVGDPSEPLLHVLRCGYCTSGMIVSAASLLLRSPHPSCRPIRASPAGGRQSPTHAAPESGRVDWVTYPILRFSEVPNVHIALVDRPGERPLGAGEPATTIVAPAIANAVFAATGARLREVPFTSPRLKRALAG